MILNIMIVNFIFFLYNQFKMREYKITFELRVRMCLFAMVFGPWIFLLEEFSDKELLENMCKKSFEAKIKGKDRCEVTEEELQRLFANLYQFLKENTSHNLFEQMMKKYDYSNTYDYNVVVQYQYYYSKDNFYYPDNLHWLLSNHPNPKKIKSIYKTTLESIESLKKIVDKNSTKSFKPLDPVIEDIFKTIHQQYKLFHKLKEEAESIIEQENETRLNQIKKHYKPRFKELKKVLESMEDDITLAE